MQDEVDLAFEFHSFCLCFICLFIFLLTTLEHVRKLYILSESEDFVVIGKLMLKKSKALTTWFLVYKYLGHRGSPVRCFLKKESVVALY